MSAAGLLRVPGPVNAHSHAFHRILRGRTHGGAAGGDGSFRADSFWTWRDQMYAAAGRLDPEGYERLATAVFAEMAVAGWTAVGEFHYLHHGPGGIPYGTGSAGGATRTGGASRPGGHWPEHAMERALARAARAAGIRLVLLDTCYLRGGLDTAGAPLPLSPTQARFCDGDAAGWLARLASLRAALEEENGAEENGGGEGGGGLVSLGAAIHSVRAVGEEDLAAIASGLDRVLGADAPLHVHLSEQPAENTACLAATGTTPAGLLARHGLLSPRLSVVHATHLTGEDIAALGAARATVVMCPSTEADLADGIGPARELADAGATIALGSDQHAVVDPYLEMRALEHGERLRSGIRGRFAPAELAAAVREGGLRSLGLLRADGTAPNGDHLLVRTGSVRTAGARPGQLPLTATAADVAAVVVNGVTVARDGLHTRLGDPAELYAAFLAEYPEYA
ncbi:formimidoylglutamate deiminase [Zafaria cholistanensis]|uniref:Formimidoylglutamate deiminase n=1 Tax=Zafaria cholistanensis TaxID=1682741 RepID=A0A5A7NNY4_9MICC|nr:formimidoylglutamate deiminase [Zafaria cholistanensis]GER22624.1 formimidoylglutamate deiminase [Zafaria cholistanensis]